MILTYSNDVMTRMKFPSGQVYDALVLDAQANQALVAIRSLGEKGLRVAAMGSHGRNIPAFLSKWCKIGLVSPAKEGTKEYADYLIEFIKRNKTGVIFSSSDGTVALLQKYRNIISRYSTIAIGSEKALATAVNKIKTLEAAKKLGINSPKSYRVKSKEDLEDAFRFLSFPIVVKPAESWTENKSGTKRVAPGLATTKEEAYKLFLESTEYGGETIFQEYLPGRREAVALLYKEKKFYAEFAQWAQRTQPPLGGSSVLRETIPMPKDIGEQARALIRAIDLEGYSLVEFRRDAKGVPYLMEINPRLTMSVVLAYDAGCDFPYLLYLLLRGRKHIPAASYKYGVWERYLAGDIINMVEALRQGGKPGVPRSSRVIYDFITTFFRPMHYDCVDFRDILPVLDATRDSIARNVKKIWKNI